MAFVTFFNQSDRFGWWRIGQGVRAYESVSHLLTWATKQNIAIFLFLFLVKNQKFVNLISNIRILLVRLKPHGPPSDSDLFLIPPPLPLSRQAQVSYIGKIAQGWAYCVVVDVTEVLKCYSMACHGCENVTIERYKVFQSRVSRLSCQKRWWLKGPPSTHIYI